jgi:hypothetical protein
VACLGNEEYGGKVAFGAAAAAENDATGVATTGDATDGATIERAAITDDDDGIATANGDADGKRLARRRTDDTARNILFTKHKHSNIRKSRSNEQMTIKTKIVDT